MIAPRTLTLTILSSILLTATLSLTQCQSTPAPTPTQPNIVYIMADELGYYELSGQGHPHHATPNLDRMAREGLQFTQALAGPSLCAPTRCCLMTGKHTGHSSVRTNGGGTPLRAGEVTIATLLKAAGYATGGFGKWGCGGRGSTGVPEKHGFDEFVGYYDQVHAHTYYPAHIVRNSAEVPLAGNRGGRAGETYAHYAIVDAAKAFIRRNKDRPFFCYMPVTPPHGMFDIPDTDPSWQKFKDQPWPIEARRYAAMVHMLDRQVGEVIALLEELGLADDTLVMFGGDNGGKDYFKDADHPRGFHAPNVHPKTGVEFRGQKGNLYEGGLRVPMIARWPGRIAPGRRSDLPWFFPDFLPTFAELAGARIPADTDGISIVPELLGAATAGRAQEHHEFFYWELGGQVAVREGSWKAIRPGAKRTWELYDLATDVSERRDVAGQHANVLSRLQAHAAASHTPAEPGEFGDRSDHQKDQRARGLRRGGRGRARNRAMHRLPQKGLIAGDELKIVRASSESEANGKLARNAIDGRPRTHWHTRFGTNLAKHPHELLLDLGRVREVRGLAYLARQDTGWNGSIAECEFFVGDSRTDIGTQGKPAARARLKKVKTAQTISCTPVQGRYVLLRILSEVNGKPWASAAELGVLAR